MLQVNLSDEFVERAKQDYDMIRRMFAEEEQAKRDREDERGSNDAPQDLCLPETHVGIAGDGSEYDLNSSGELTFGGLTVEGLQAIRRRLSDPKVGRGRGRGKGRGFKKKRWSSSQEKRPLSIAHGQDLWFLTAGGLGGGLGLDHSQEGLKAAAESFLAAETPRFNFSLGSSHGDRASPIISPGLSQFPVEESHAGEGSSGLTAGTNEGGDESVAVVGSTSSVTGLVICEHCGLTFPSAHSLAVHSRSTHLLYVCPCCGKHFHHATNLTRHMAVHRGGGKAHQCPLCYKTFTQKSTLIDHMNLHSGERPHHCAYCHARFAHKPALRRHLKEQHGKTTGQNSLHEQEERVRAFAAAGGVKDDEQECLVTDTGVEGQNVGDVNIWSETRADVKEVL